MSGNGRWLSRPRVEYSDDGEIVTLTDALKFVDPKEVCWVAPKDAKADGASIPRVFWLFIGSPLKGSYVAASIIHDFYCSVRTRPWKSVHRAFYEAMICSDVPLAKAKVMYAAVYYRGPRWTEMDSANVLVLKDLGIENFKEEQRTIYKWIEDCAGPLNSRQDGEGPPDDDVSSIEEALSTEEIEQSQLVFSFPIQDVNGEVAWLKEQFETEDEVDLSDIDETIDARIAATAKVKAKQRYMEMS